MMEEMAKWSKSCFLLGRASELKYVENLRASKRWFDQMKAQHPNQLLSPEMQALEAELKRGLAKLSLSDTFRDPFFFIYLSRKPPSIDTPELTAESLRCDLIAGEAYVQLKNGQHAIAVFIDTVKHSLEWYDSNGIVTGIVDFYSTDDITALFKQWVATQPLLKGYTVSSPDSLCIADGVQTDTGGTCAAWSTLTIMLRFLCVENAALVPRTVASYSKTQRRRIIINWIALCVQIYHFYVLKASKPADARMETTLPFAPILADSPAFRYPDESQTTSWYSYIVSLYNAVLGPRATAANSLAVRKAIRPSARHAPAKRARSKKQKRRAAKRAPAKRKSKRKTVRRIRK
jgi:hypothetical protein